MTLRIFATLLFFFLAVRAEGAMVRVVGVVDGRTIVVERGGGRSNVTLAGITLTDDVGARTLLEWALANAWVMLEEQKGGAFVYRSPDALFVNRELVLRGFARATMGGVEPVSHVPVTYLGQLNPSGAQPSVERPAAAPKARSGSGTSRRSPGRPSRSARRGGS